MTSDRAALLPFSVFAPLSRMEAEIVQQQAPPSYGQLIAEGAIPPVDDFPTENPNDVSHYSSHPGPPPSRHHASPSHSDP